MQKRLLIGSLGIFAALSTLGCGGNGTDGQRATSSTNSTGGNGNSGGFSAAASAPSEVQGTLNATITSVSPGGRMVGYTLHAIVPNYWSSPTAAPQPLSAGAFTGVLITAVNDAGQIVGFAGQGTGSYQAIYWSSPSATPVALLAPGTGEARCFGLNASGAIVGDSGSSGNQPVYWASPSSAPTILTGVGGASASGAQAIQISDSGIVYGVSGRAPLYWTSPQAQAQSLPMPSGTAVYGATSTLLAMNQATGEVGAASQAGGNPIGPLYWAPPGFGMTALPVPSGFTSYSVVTGIGPNHVLVGEANEGTLHAVVWTSPTAPFKDLVNVVPAAPGWVLKEAQYITSDGTIIGIGTDPGGNQAYFVTHM